MKRIACLMATGLIVVSTGVGSRGAAASVPNVRLRAGHVRADGTVTVRVLGQGVREFSALSMDLRLGSTPLTLKRCVQPPSGVDKTAVCSEAEPGVVRVALVGFNDDPLRDGELARVELKAAAVLRAGRYPISAVLHLARPDGSEFEIGPIGATVRVGFKTGR